MFSIEWLCPVVSSAAPGLTGPAAHGAALSAEILHGAIGPQHCAGCSLAEDSNMYTDPAAPPNNCVGVCDKEPFSGSPWTVPSPQHWYAHGHFAGMTPAQELAAMPPPPSGSSLDVQEAVIGPHQPLQCTDMETISVAGPLPKPAALPLGFVAISTPRTESAASTDAVLTALSAVWSHKAEEQMVPDDAVPAANRVRPTPGHVVMCGNALILAAASSLRLCVDKTIKGEKTSNAELANNFRECAASSAEAVTPVGGHWLRHHVLKSQAACAEDVENTSAATPQGIMIA